MDIQHGRRKPFDIEYVVVTPENINEVAEWCNGVVGGDYIQIKDKNAINTRQTKAFVGDVVVHHLELQTFKSFGVKSFNKSYEALASHKIARDSGTGEYITLEAAEADPEGTVIETNTVIENATDERTPAEKKADEVEGVAYMHPSNTELPRDADPS